MFTSWRYANGFWGWYVTDYAAYIREPVSDMWVWDRALTQTERTRLYCGADPKSIPGGRKLI